MSHPTSKSDSVAPSPEAQNNDIFLTRSSYRLPPSDSSSSQHQGSELPFPHTGSQSLYNTHLYLPHSDSPKSTIAKPNEVSTAPMRTSFSAFNGVNAVHGASITPHTAPPGSFRMRQSDSFVTDAYGAHQPFLKHHLSSHAGVDTGPLNTKASQPFTLESLVKAQLQPQAHDAFLALSHNPSATQMPYLNGVAVQSQTPYGPHLQSNGGAMSNNRNVGASGQSTGAVETQGSQQEEISTIFVVGFPDDMQEREFQNMFTFSPGFEAATLKIPNREYTAYGSAGTPSNVPRGGSYAPYLNAGQNDPYNIVTVNQGGVVVDNGRDGPTASWPPLPVPLAEEPSHFQTTSGGQPPRKQIIGFAKFRTRQEALEARDVLQGRRIDVEKGAVLKAEMAKKNLHTKRGVGIGNTSSGGGNALNGVNALGPGGSVGGLGALNGFNVTPDALAGLAAGLNINSGMGLGSVPMGGADILTARELGYKNLATGWRDGKLGESSEDERERDREADRERRREALGAMGLGMGMGIITRGARERAMAEEELRRKDTKQAQNDSHRMHSTISDAFQSLSPMPRNTQGGFVSPSTGNDDVGPNSDSTVPFNGDGFGSIIAQTSVKGEGSQSSPDVSVGPWDLPSPREREAFAYAAMSFYPSRKGAAVSGRPSSSQGSSPSKSSLVFSPTFTGEEMLPNQRLRTTQSVDSASDDVVLPPMCIRANCNGESTSEGDGPGPLVVCTSAKVSMGSTSPQLPSPGSHSESGGSSAGGHAGSPSSAGPNGVGGAGPRNALIDQNPPINTLYVGNLPTGSIGGYPVGQLEDSLRELFSRRPGYRKLCFRQKSNGPMCFVEFEDVHYATKSLNELYGHTLNGLVKNGGIRLSYSKNPLGVRTPTGAGTGSSSLQQNGQLGSASPFAADTFPQRQGFEVDSGVTTIRRESANVASPNPSTFGYSRSPPPPRFFSPPPTSGNFGITSTSTPLNTAFPRGSQPFGLSVGGAVGPTNFSPFGLPLSSPQTVTPSHPMIPDHTSSEASLSHGHPQHFTHRALSPSGTTLEAARAG